MYGSTSPARFDDNDTGEQITLILRRLTKIGDLVPSLSFFSNWSETQACCFLSLSVFTCLAGHYIANVIPCKRSVDAALVESGAWTIFYPGSDISFFS